MPHRAAPTPDAVPEVGIEIPLPATDGTPERVAAGTDPAVPSPSARGRDPVGQITHSHGSIHVVRAGESLWSIARDTQGARASEARVARYVDDLWRLNAPQIATGNPSLIFAGQHLRLA